VTQCADPLKIRDNSSDFLDKELHSLFRLLEEFGEGLRA